MCRAMCSMKKMSRKFFSLGALLALALGASAATGAAQSLFPESIGVRGGVEVAGTESSALSQTEGFADWNLPWKWETESGWYLQTRVTLSAGWLGGEGHDSFTSTVAPALGLGRSHFPLWLEGGAGPTYISQYEFGGVNFGQNLQFTSFIGLNFDLTSHWRLGYRFQHMSNAGLAKSNPGLNLNMFALSYVF